MQTHLANRMDGLNGSAIREIFKLLGDPSIISFAEAPRSSEAVSPKPQSILLKMSSNIALPSGIEFISPQVVFKVKCTGSFVSEDT